MCVQGLYALLKWGWATGLQGGLNRPLCRIQRVRDMPFLLEAMSMSPAVLLA